MTILPPLPNVPDADPSKSILDSFRIAIAKCISDALPSLTLDQAYGGVDYGKKGVDFTVALPRFRLPGKPSELARKIVDKFTPNEYISSVVHDNVFLHFNVNSASLVSSVLNQVHVLSHPEPTANSPNRTSIYGHNNSGLGKKVVIEYSSPNIAKEFHVGHLRSTIIGAFLVNLYRACGWEVVAMNYLGDWGTQFGLLATGFDKHGSDEELQSNPIRHLFDVYVAINKEVKGEDEAHALKIKAEAAAYFKRMEDGDESALRNWRLWRELSVKRYQEIYATLGIDFDVYTGESQVPSNLMNEAFQKLDGMGRIVEKAGSKRVDLEEWQLDSPVLRKSDGTSIYLMRDIGAAIDRYERYKFDRMLYVVAAQQDQHLRQLFKTLSLLDAPWAGTLQHVNYGMVNGMSTRKGTAVFLDKVVEEAATVMHEQMKKNEAKYQAVVDPDGVSREIGITAIKIQDMAAKRINSYNFSWDRMTSFEGDTGPYLQYAHVRLASIERKHAHLLPLPSPSEIDSSCLASSTQARAIIFLLGTYPDVVKVAMKTHEPSGVVTFAFRLSHAISSAWETVLVKGEEDVAKAKARMWMYICARDVLGEAMRLLTMRPLERM